MEPAMMANRTGSSSCIEDRVGGLREPAGYLRKLLLWPEEFREAGNKLGVTWPTGILLHGPPGTGKSLVVKSACEECGATLIGLTPSSVFGAFVGETEKKLREIFLAADELVEQGRSVVLFFDEVDVLCPRRDRSGPFECRLVAQVLTLMDTSVARAAHNRKLGRKTGVLLLVGATSNQNAVDPAIRRPGRMEKEIALGMPDERDRAEILALYLKRIPLAGDLAAAGGLDRLSKLCSGYTGADLSVLCHEASLAAMERCEGGEGAGEGIAVEMADFEAARAAVRPTAARGETRDAPPVRWSHIAGLHDCKLQLERAVHWPLRHPQAFSRLGLQSFRGALLYGPPGCCKTKLCRAAATEAGVPMIAMSCAEVLSMYVGESEERLRACFARARLSSPSVLFLDEFDAFCSARGSGGEGGGSVGDRLLATFLTEMDGLEQVAGVVVLAATNRPEQIDAALLRPGRFDVLLYVPPPGEEERREILEQMTAGMGLREGVELGSLAARTEGFTGAELEALCREAYMTSSSSGRGSGVGAEDFEDALSGMAPMLTREDIEGYEAFRGARGGMKG